MGGSSAWEYDAHSRTWQPMPALDGYARFTRAVVDRRSGNVILHVGREQGWHDIDPQTRPVVRSFDRDPYGRFIEGPAVFDQRAGNLYRSEEHTSELKSLMRISCAAFCLQKTKN